MRPAAYYNRLKEATTAGLVSTLNEHDCPNVGPILDYFQFQNEAMEYLHSENEISHKKNLIYQHYIMTFDKKNEETKQKKAEFEESCKELLEKLTKITAKKEKREGQMKELSKKYEDTSKELEGAREMFKKHEMTDEKLREDMKSTNTKRKKTMQLSKLEKDNYEKISKIPEVNREKIEECQGLLGNSKK